MSEVDELIGKKFNMLTVSKYIGRSGKNNRRYYECLCDCGNKADFDMVGMMYRPFLFIQQ